MKTTRLVTCALLPLALLLGCGEREAAEAAVDSPPAVAAPTEADKASGAGDTTRARAELPPERKLIQNAVLGVEVESYAQSRAAIDRELAEAGGFVADAKVERHDGAVWRATLKLRVPQRKLSQFLSGAAGEGKVLHEQLKTEDVTEGYYDLQARLGNAKKLEARLLELMAAKTDGVQALLEVERELARVREEIERMEGRLKLMDSQVSFSTVDLELVAKTHQLAVAPPSFGERAGKALERSFSGLVSLGDGLAIAAVALLPWLPVLALLALFIRFLVRLPLRKAASHAKASLPPAMPSGTLTT